MIDVGHANCAAIHVARSADSRIIGYYDVGAPIFFHHGTFPKAFLEQRRIPDDGFVILSHWDFDHYALAVTRLKDLQELQWYAPNQSVGPNAARLQSQLGGRLHFIDAKQVPILSNLRLWKGLGPILDRNSSGYVLRATRGNDSALLTGDVSYEAIEPAAKSRLMALGITHHGGKGSANPPQPHGEGHAVVSYGLPNRYGHPSEQHLKAHEAAGWKVRRTAGDSIFARGDIWLF
jgi:beta-lactamase superfamily II metal-dependent hydrolase